MTYSILSVHPEEVEDIEQLGSKPKFWLRREGERWLFKEGRPKTGEDWAEKVAAEVARLAGVSAARVELAEFQGRPGCACRSFVAIDSGDVLVHGNELLAGLVLGYDKHKRQHQSDHTLLNIEQAIRKVFPEANAVGILQQLATYATLDAVIGNTDRHHENWGLLLSIDVVAKHARVQVAPSFDHASSLGRELSDARREELLRTNQVEAYLARGRGGIYINSTDPHGANPFELVRFGCLRLPELFLPSRQRLLDLDLNAVETAIAEVPDDRMSGPAKRFALKVVRVSLEKLRRIPT